MVVSTSMNGGQYISEEMTKRAGFTIRERAVDFFRSREHEESRRHKGEARSFVEH